MLESKHNAAVRDLSNNREILHILFFFFRFVFFCLAAYFVLFHGITFIAYFCTDMTQYAGIQIIAYKQASVCPPLRHNSPVNASEKVSQSHFKFSSFPWHSKHLKLSQPPHPFPQSEKKKKNLRKTANRQNENDMLFHNRLVSFIISLCAQINCAPRRTRIMHSIFFSSFCRFLNAFKLVIVYSSTIPFLI